MNSRSFLKLCDFLISSQAAVAATMLGLMSIMFASKFILNDQCCRRSPSRLIDMSCLECMESLLVNGDIQTKSSSDFVRLL